MRLLLLEEFVVHENVETFDVQILLDFFAAAYCIHTAVFCCSALGWPVRRNRRITICIRLDMLLNVTFSWSDYVHSCKRVCEVSWKIFVAQRNVDLLLERELLWATNRRDSLARIPDESLLAVISQECLPWRVNPNRVLKLVKESKYTRSLIASEARRLYMYRQLNKTRGGSPDLMICCPGRDPLTHPHLSGCATMSTVISSTSLLWADGLTPARSLSPAEVLASQGFCTLPEHVTYPGMETSFFWDREGRGRSGCAQAGNAMNVQVMGIEKLIKFRMLSEGRL